ncbi:Transcriptional regulator, contains XRE-family HTH domain [Actinopolyspora alba]|uniref:Transcriptional regulator, contains XRE-family HTH domain n=1 Tax=Actinopolyspora alba TaxID=673379 RepID=A0A1I1XI35_9ACTN|nr:XRE family transcriptional regulator [Actinopolyspora alba]SFE07059.1 Transcriptional regulator, contains XRE-family HTH domain [Actinopolyspora alba]
MEMVKVVGANLRAARDHRGLSLSEVARRADLGKGTLSELEAGQRNPTLETLYALATVLGVPLGLLLIAETESPTATTLVARGTEHAELSGQAVDVRLVDRTSSGGQVLEIYRIHVRAGKRYASPAHRPRVVEQLLVHSGTLTTGPASAPETLGPGDYIRFDGGVDHVYAAPHVDVHGTLVMRYGEG